MRYCLYETNHFDRKKPGLMIFCLQRFIFEQCLQQQFVCDYYEKSHDKYNP